MTLAISSLTTEYVRVPVSAQEQGVRVSPTNDTVKLAFPLRDIDPQGSDWNVAGWETDTTGPSPVYYARLIIGPTGGAVALAKGLYDVWVQILAGAETVIRKAGEIIVD